MRKGRRGNVSFWCVTALERATVTSATINIALLYWRWSRDWLPWTRQVNCLVIGSGSTGTLENMWRKTELSIDVPLWKNHMVERATPLNFFGRCRMENGWDGWRKLCCRRGRGPRRYRIRGMSNTKGMESMEYSGPWPTVSLYVVFRSCYHCYGICLGSRRIKPERKTSYQRKSTGSLRKHYLNQFIISQSK